MQGKVALDTYHIVFCHIVEYTRVVPLAIYHRARTTMHLSDRI
jgi:hypothetical protein